MMTKRSPLPHWTRSLPLLLVLGALPAQEVRAAAAGEVELLRDQWGVAHVFASREADGFFGLGFASAQDRLLQADLLRRRARGQLAEVFGEKWVDSDRKFRLAGLAQHCAAALERLPAEMQEDLAAYAAGVNAYMRSDPAGVQRRFAALGVQPAAWTPSDCLAAWHGFAEVFDHLYDESVVQFYNEFSDLVRTVGEAEASARRGMVVDDQAAIVSEAEFARDKESYARLKARPRSPGFAPRSATNQAVRLSHAWAVDGTRSTTGKPLLESDPQTSVNLPAIWYEFHLAAGRYDVRGVGVAGCPAMLVGWNRRVAWGATALGAGGTVTFLERLATNGTSPGYVLRGQTQAFTRRLERIAVKDGPPVIQEILTNPHGFVFNSLARQTRAGEGLVSYFKQAQDQATSVRGMLEWMRAADWTEFRAAMRHYYSPGLHLVYADTAGNIAYQTGVQVPLTRRSPRLALEGWTGEDEVRGTVPLEDLPHLFNPEAHVISHANNLPVGAWYPYDLGLSTGGIGDTTRSMRLRQILEGQRKFSVDDFEALVHRDDVNAAVAALWPAARRVAEEDAPNDPALTRLLDGLKDWDLHFRSTEDSYPHAMALAGNLVLAYRASGLRDRFGGGEGGICHLARRIAEQGGPSQAAPQDRAVRGYLLSWLRAAATGGGRRGAGASERPAAAAVRREPATHKMPYQASGPLAFPSVDPALDMVSPPLHCTETGTIWSQHGNSYSQIVDLGDVDRSRSLLPPGVSEDPESPYYTNQVALWVRGATHPAPLSRKAVEALTVSRKTLQAAPYAGPCAPAITLAPTTDEPGVRFIAAIPQANPGRQAAAAQPLPGRKPDDAQLEASLRYLIRTERTPDEVETRIAELKAYVKESSALRAELVSGLKLVLHLKYGTAVSQERMAGLLRELDNEPGK